MARALSTVATVSKERSASTSVETRPGTIAASSAPKATASRSHTAATRAVVDPACLRPQATASSTIAACSGISAALSRSVGLVVQSTGRSRLTASMSPVSATIRVMAAS